MVRGPAPRCEECTQERSELFCGLRGKAADRLAAAKNRLHYRRGQPLFREGEPPRSLFVICSGRVKVFTGWDDGDEQVLRLLGSGELLGYRPLLAGEPYNASAEAIEDSVICVIPAPVALELIRNVPELALGLLAKLATELRLSEALLMGLLRAPVRQRVARLLLGFLADAGRTAGELTIEPEGLRRKDMARMVATSPETLSRTLRALSRQGILALTRDRIRVLDIARLRAVADNGDALDLDRRQDGR